MTVFSVHYVFYYNLKLKKLLYYRNCTLIFFIES